MGTLTVGIWSEKLDSDISYDLEQYLEEINPKLSLEEREVNKFNKSNFYLDKSGYLKHTYGYIDRKFIMVLSNPKPFMSRMFDYKVTWHQSQWKNQEEVVKEFTKIFGIKNAECILCQSQILRFDAWLDCEVEYDLFKRSTYRSGVSCLDQRKSIRLSCYYGTKKPKQAVIYQRAYSPALKMDISKNGRYEAEYYTRAEVRYFNKMVPIRSYSDYHQTSDLKLFAILKTILIYKNRFIAAAEKSKLNTIKVAKFLELADREGLHHARAVLNQNRNFYRTLEPLLYENGLVLDLSRMWKRKVKEEIIANFEIIEFFKRSGGDHV